MTSRIFLILSIIFISQVSFQNEAQSQGNIHITGHINDLFWCPDSTDFPLPSFERRAGDSASGGTSQSSSLSNIPQILAEGAASTLSLIPQLPNPSEGYSGNGDTGGGTALTIVQKITPTSNMTLFPIAIAVKFVMDEIMVESLYWPPTLTFQLFENLESIENNNPKIIADLPIAQVIHVQFCSEWNANFVTVLAFFNSSITIVDEDYALVALVVDDGGFARIAGTNDSTVPDSDNYIVNQSTLPPTVLSVVGFTSGVVNRPYGVVTVYNEVQI